MGQPHEHDQSCAPRDHQDITDLIDRYFLSLDERNFDDSWARSMCPSRARNLVSGGYYEGVLACASDGWRFRRQSFHLVWANGDPPQRG